MKPKFVMFKYNDGWIVGKCYETNKSYVLNVFIWYFTSNENDAKRYLEMVEEDVQDE